ncbi:MAG: HAD-IC family P-type ATPase [Gammaproteobacteria bacterium]|nr:HAD-IC family P-type ATPase [Gammaproteobacteria bacterium]
MSDTDNFSEEHNQTRGEKPRAEDVLLTSAHTSSVDEILAVHQSTHHGLTQTEASSRLEKNGPNSLPEAKPSGIGIVFLHQFASPLIYVLIVAAILSVAIEEWSDAGFITAVLLINGIIGTIQEYSAQRAATALRNLVSTRCLVLRDGDSYEIDAADLVTGDIILLESGDKIPADVRLLASNDLEVDESLLTGESTAVLKDANLVLEIETTLADRRNMLFAGSLVQRGRGRGIVVSTALDTELGHIAASVLNKPATKAPLMIRMERFTHRVAIIVAVAAIIMAMISLSRGMPMTDIFLLAVALAVSAIPEGLPVALTVALAIGMRRMARRNVIIRKLIAVESLGSCTFIATDKTGTLTVNQLTVRRIAFPALGLWNVTGASTEPEGDIIALHEPSAEGEKALLEHLCQTAVLANEGFLSHRDNGWVHHGDAVDIALLVMAHKIGITKAETVNACPEIETIPFESEHLFCASLNKVGATQCAFVKGALERLLPMCNRMASIQGDVDLNHQLLEEQARELASQGYRVIALASGETELRAGEIFSEEHLNELALIGLIGMIDPLRPEAKDAIARCQKAGIEVAMITGDHPVTAMAIAKELDLIRHSDQIITGPELKHFAEDGKLDELIREVRVFARVEPQQKLDIVQSLQRLGHFVAVSGDGANDAPALRAAHVGIAMGKSGTDVARETADLIITDDNFSSIVAGVEEGRIAYSNVRKVIFLLISTGMAELVLFALALLTALPLPLLAVHLLWLNLVTNGIQDVALAFEPGEGHELNRPPRSPKDPIFNRIMIERVVISAVLIGVVAFFLFQYLLGQGYNVDEARNGTLLLMVLFENIHVFNCRSETSSVFQHNPMGNRILLFGTVAAQLIHIGAMYTPWIRDVLHIQPVSMEQWLQLLGLALTVLIVMELHKFVRRIKIIKVNF